MRGVREGYSTYLVYSAEYIWVLYGLPLPVLGFGVQMTGLAC